MFATPVLNAFVFAFALFGVASKTGVVFMATPALLTSQILLVVPVALTALLLMRLAVRAGRPA